MSLTREDMLNELELLPVWHLRQLPQVAITEPVVAKQMLAEQSIVEPVIPPPPISEVVESDPLVLETSLPHPELESSMTISRASTIAQLDWQALQSCVADCQACSLAKTRTQTVFGVGDSNADWLIVGEAPGAEEDKRGEPFVGQAGKLLDNMLGAIQLKRGSNVYIANVLKCRPPENRDPHGEEVLQCDPFLKRQVELIQPKLIVALGKFAAQSLLGSDQSIASMRGKLHDYHGVPVVVTYHPAYLLRNLPDKAKAWEDLCLARRTMAELQSADQPTQALQSTLLPPSLI